LTSFGLRRGLRIDKSAAMKALIITTTLFVCVLSAVDAQQNPNATAPKASDADLPILEAKIRQAWADVKNKQKESFARIFTNDAIEVEEGAEGPYDLKATLAEFDDFSLTNYALGDFHYRRIGADGMLVRYKLEYAATLAGETIHSKSIIGEVWEKRAGDWKLFYF
jgi:hypothetical protein